MIPNILETRNSKYPSTPDEQENYSEKKKKSLKEISALLQRRKTEGYLSSDDMNIFPLTKASNHKYLQAKDFVEIAIRYCIMDDDEILNFW